jgi:hypothetical protein
MNIVIVTGSRCGLQVFTRYMAKEFGARRIRAMA